MEDTPLLNGARSKNLDPGFKTTRKGCGSGGVEDHPINHVEDGLEREKLGLIRGASSWPTWIRNGGGTLPKCKPGIISEEEKGSSRVGDVQGVAGRARPAQAIAYKKLGSQSAWGLVTKSGLQIWEPSAHTRWCESCTQRCNKEARGPRRVARGCCELGTKEEGERGLKGSTRRVFHGARRGRL